MSVDYHMQWWVVQWWVVLSKMMFCCSQIWYSILDSVHVPCHILVYDLFVDQCLTNLNWLNFHSIVFTESLRLHPSFPFYTRKCTKNYQIPDTNVVIEEGTLLYFSVTGLQYDPKYYDEPTKFKPERQSEAYKAGKTFVDMPNLTFGDGQRNCLGMRFGKLQSKIAIVLLLRKFKFDLADQHKNTELKLNPFAPTPYPIHGINLKVFCR